MRVSVIQMNQGSDKAANLDQARRLVEGECAALAALTRTQPLWTLSIDAGRTLQAGFHFDGSRAERELGLQYTPIRDALYEAICDYRKNRGR